MSQDLISRYQKSFGIQFQKDETEAKYRDMQEQLGRSSSLIAFGALFILCLAFAYLEFRAFGHDVQLPMYGYLLSAILALANLLLSRFSDDLHYPKLRLIGNGLLAMGIVIVAVFTQKYSAYHALEFVLLVIWLGSLKLLRMVITLALNALMVLLFVGAMFATDVSGFRISLVSVLLAAAMFLAAYLGYMTERSRRMMFLQTELNRSMTNRQELWAFTLIDLDMALSGILDFKELIALLKKHLEPVIEFDSYILTSLEGQGPKPVADKIEGELFEDDDKTFWSEDLLGKLTQTRQATTSSEHEIVKGFLGMEKQRFISYRLDVPVFNDSRLLGVISLRRESEPFDELDTIASVSIAAQAMLIFKRSTRNSAMALEKTVPDSVTRPKKANPVIKPKKADPVISAIKSQDKTSPPAMTASSSESKDMEMTDHTFIDSDQTLVPKEVVQEIKQREESAKRTITLMSRENADKIAVDRYRTAAVEGEPLSVLIIEVDGLSKLREEDGDQVAYKVFAAIVKYIFSKVEKDKDILGRYGQNGLSVLLPRVDMNAAEKFAESLREYVADAHYKTAYGEKKATLSIGLAAITDDTGDYASMVKRADMALFVAKKNGRNCVKVRL
ncbi:MAG: GGDEF domain-containing protein [Gammaproteobacteria bacterium]|nr:GGDEF domain-containing protein [Gammaproteobacteria bacterium]